MVGKYFSYNTHTPWGPDLQLSKWWLIPNSADWVRSKCIIERRNQTPVCNPKTQKRFFSKRRREISSRSQNEIGKVNVNWNSASSVGASISMGKEKDAKASPAKKDATKSPSKSSSKVKKETGNGLKLRSYAACSTFYQTITVGFLGQFRSINFDSLGYIIRSSIPHS